MSWFRSSKCSLGGACQCNKLLRFVNSKRRVHLNWWEAIMLLLESHCLPSESFRGKMNVPAKFTDLPKHRSADSHPFCNCPRLWLNQSRAYYIPSLLFLGRPVWYEPAPKTRWLCLDATLFWVTFTGSLFTYVLPHTLRTKVQRLNSIVATNDIK